MSVEQAKLIASLLLVAMPLVPSSFLLLVLRLMPGAGATHSVLAPSSEAQEDCSNMFYIIVSQAASSSSSGACSYQGLDTVLHLGRAGKPTRARATYVCGRSLKNPGVCRRLAVTTSKLQTPHLFSRVHRLPAQIVCRPQSPLALSIIFSLCPCLVEYAHKSCPVDLLFVKNYTMFHK